MKFFSLWFSGISMSQHTEASLSSHLWRRFSPGAMGWFLVQLLFSHSVMSDSLQPCELQHSRLPCPSPSPSVCSNSCPLNHPTISSSVIPFSSCLQSFPSNSVFSNHNNKDLPPIPFSFCTDGYSSDSSSSEGDSQTNPEFSSTVCVSCPSAQF